MSPVPGNCSIEEMNQLDGFVHNVSLLFLESQSIAFSSKSELFPGGGGFQKAQALLLKLNNLSDMMNKEFWDRVKRNDKCL